MADSEATKEQKRAYLENIKELIIYIEVHGLDKIKLSDLKDANTALDRAEVPGF